MVGPYYLLLSDDILPPPQRRCQPTRCCAGRARWGPLKTLCTDHATKQCITCWLWDAVLFFLMTRGQHCARRWPVLMRLHRLLAVSQSKDRPGGGHDGRCGQRAVHLGWRGSRGGRVHGFLSCQRRRWSMLWPATVVVRQTVPRSQYSIPTVRRKALCTC